MFTILATPTKIAHMFCSQTQQNRAVGTSCRKRRTACAAKKLIEMFTIPATPTKIACIFALNLNKTQQSGFRARNIETATKHMLCKESKSPAARWHRSAGASVAPSPGNEHHAKTIPENKNATETRGNQKNAYDHVETHAESDVPTTRWQRSEGASTFPCLKIADQ